MRRAKPGNMCTDGPTRLAAKQAFGDAIKSVFSAENLGCRCIAPTIVRPKQLAHLDHIYIYTYINIKGICKHDLGLHSTRACSTMQASHCPYGDSLFLRWLQSWSSWVIPHTCKFNRSNHRGIPICIGYTSISYQSML